MQFVQVKQNMPETATFGLGAKTEAIGGSVRSSIESGNPESRQKASQIVQLKFHYTKRMADILREEAENERRIQAEKEAIRAAQEEAHR